MDVHFWNGEPSEHWANVRSVTLALRMAAATSEWSQRGAWSEWRRQKARELLSPRSAGFSSAHGVSELRERERVA